MKEELDYLRNKLEVLEKEFDDLWEEKEYLETELEVSESTIESLESDLKFLQEYEKLSNMFESYRIDPDNLDFQMKLEYFLSECDDMRSSDFEEMVKKYKEEL